MKVLMINSVCGIRSTGRICTDLAQALEAQGHTVKIAYGREQVPDQYQKYAVRIGTDLDVKIAGAEARMLDNMGLANKRATERFLEWADKYNPDLLWLHNIHGYYINYEILFDWIKARSNMKVKWTLHDCWAFTGHCSYFTMAKCEQWKTHCKDCVQLKEYPVCYTKGNVFENFDRKRRSFVGVQNMTLITPSKWLADLTRQSFLKDYPVEVHHNTVDTTIFKPTPSNFREKFHLKDKIIILGVASVWDKRKGLKDFIQLSQMLDNNYVIVLVGLNRKQIKELPENVKGIKRTSDTKELATIYSAADVFVNPSKEETFGMTTLEAESCGTKTIVYDDTACAEIAEYNGSKVVPQSVYALYKAITGKEYVISGSGGGKGITIYEIICLPNTNSAKELAMLYTSSDYFINPTYEDNYPTTNLEARACGTKVITYDTGGCGETI